MPFVESDGLQIYYEVDGAGPGLVFLHGGGSNATTWWQQIDHFVSSYTCVAIDSRGFGRTHPLSEAVFAVDDYCNDVFAVMDAVGLERAAAICQSMGAWTGLRMAMRRPERVWGFVGCSAPMGVENPQALVDALEFIQSLTESGQGIEDAALSETFRTGSPDRYRLYRQLNSFNPLPVHGAAHGLDPQALVGAMFSPDIMIAPEELSAVDVPAVLISGGQDGLVRTPTMRNLADHLGNATLEVFPDCGHSPYFEQPDAFNQLVDRYLTSFRQQRGI